MVLAYHVIFGTYGFWLPNDPRGSGSRFVGAKALLKFGNATHVDSERSVAARPHDRAKRMAAKRMLKYPPVSLTGRLARAVAIGFKQAAIEGNYAIHALAILPNHTHFVIGKHRRSISRIIGHLKTRSLQQTVAEGLWPDDGTPIWGERGRHVFLDSVKRVRAAIRYVEQNPTKDRKPRQRWSFVVPYGVSEPTHGRRRASSPAQ